jgi:hypothetical protein
MGRLDEVEVYETYTNRWVGGFEIADRDADGGAVWIRRTDGSVLPEAIASERVRPVTVAPPDG